MVRAGIAARRRAWPPHGAESRAVAESRWSRRGPGRARRWHRRSPPGVRRRGGEIRPVPASLIRSDETGGVDAQRIRGPFGEHAGGTEDVENGGRRVRAEGEHSCRAPFASRTGERLPPSRARRPVSPLSTVAPAPGTDNSRTHRSSARVTDAAGRTAGGSQQRPPSLRPALYHRSSPTLDSCRCTQPTAPARMRPAHRGPRGRRGQPSGHAAAPTQAGRPAHDAFRSGCGQLLGCRSRISTVPRGSRTGRPSSTRSVSSSCVARNPVGPCADGHFRAPSAGPACHLPWDTKAGSWSRQPSPFSGSGLPAAQPPPVARKRFAAVARMRLVWTDRATPLDRSVQRGRLLAFRPGRARRRPFHRVRQRAALPDSEWASASPGRAGTGPASALLHDPDRGGRFTATAAMLRKPPLTLLASAAIGTTRRARIGDGTGSAAPGSCRHCS